ncbi:hypothetical protein AB5I39_00510 [Sphingomonas sp. MMS24-J45]|uniref:hypothetical protein n=1 Tax=Sphingomonas sp. MMS24-J45 TaxID=3238806 RepID=UPI00384D1C33
MSLFLFLAALAQAAPAAPAPSIDGLPIGAIPRQDLPARGCAAYLWTATGTRALVAMAQADPARLRLSIAGTIVDLERSAQVGAGGFGFAETTDYGGGSTAAKLTLKIETKGSIVAGAMVPEGILQIDRAGQDSVVIPVAGMIGCAT